MSPASFPSSFNCCSPFGASALSTSAGRASSLPVACAARLFRIRFAASIINASFFSRQTTNLSSPTSCKRIILVTHYRSNNDAGKSPGTCAFCLLKKKAPARAAQSVAHGAGQGGIVQTKKGEPGRGGKMYPTAQAVGKQ